MFTTEMSTAQQGWESRMDIMRENRDLVDMEIEKHKEEINTWTVSELFAALNNQQRAELADLVDDLIETSMITTKDYDASFHWGETD